jgi:poly(beta-D-mannuronate) lyase
MNLTHNSRIRALPWAILALLPSLSVSQTLRSPWDVQVVQVTDASYIYKIPKALPADITASDYYSDSKHSVIDPVRYAAYNAVEKRFRDTMKVVESCADKFQRTGSKEAADGVLKILALNAQASAMTGKMSSQQAYYLQNWTIGALAITWLKVRSAQPGTPEDRQMVAAWLKQVAGSTQGYFDRGRAKGSSDSRNNHYYWAGLAVMSAGVAADDKALFDWGVGTYDDGISRIQPDGTLPLEMSRGKKALHYHLFAMAPLVTMAEFGVANGLDLYTRGDSALARLVSRATAGLTDNSYFAEKAGVAQDTPSQGQIKSDDVICLVPYVRRYPNPELSRLIQSVTLKPYNFLGGMPPP